MLRRVILALAFASVACEDDSIGITDPADGGTLVVEPDGGTVEEVACWQNQGAVLDPGGVKDFGRIVEAGFGKVFAASYDRKMGDVEAGWRVDLLGPTDEGGWDSERSMRARVLGLSGVLVEAMVLTQDDLWFGVPSADGGGAVWRVSPTLEGDLTMVTTPTVGVEFGASIAVDESWLVVGDPAFEGGGAIHFFRVEPDDVVFHSTQVVPAPPRGQRFGETLALRSGRLMVGAPSACESALRCSDTGLMHEFALESGAWARVSTVDPGDPKVRRFGHDIAWIDDSSVLVGAPDSYHCVDRCFETSNTRPTAGSAECAADQFPCRSVGTTFIVDDVRADPIEPETSAINAMHNTRRGSAVAIGESWVAIGARSDSSCSVQTPLSFGCQAAGAVHLFSRGDGVLEPYRYLKPDDVLANSRFGQSVALDGRRMVVGAPGHCGQTPGTNCTRSGVVYVFEACE